MRALSSPLRRQLETAVLAARRGSESAARAALDGLGVFTDRRPEHLDEARAALRTGLRAKLRQFGDDRELLVSECAYEQWHRLLFARFLADNGLLLHPQYRAPVTLEECEELAGEMGEPDGWSLAARFAAEILPGIFRLNDPCVQLRFAPEGRDRLERIIADLPVEVFAADDALGWVYQFWQKDKKDEVNASGRKIGAANLGPVTQLFTENYMVRFLLENSLGAWWSSRHPNSPLVKAFEYLRVDATGKAAAGTFDLWPESIAEVTVMDPCCGSGHFLVEAFWMLWRMRAEEENLSAIEAQDAVLRDNLFGLELDARCVQIAMFAIALAAWKAGGMWRQLPTPNIACSGIPVRASVDEWKTLAQKDQRLEEALGRLHTLFRNADTLGSLIDPRRATEFTDPTGVQTSLEDVDWEEVAPVLALAAASEISDPATAVLGASVAGLARAADYLSRRYTLISTNVPYLARRHQADLLAEHLERTHPNAAANLATTCLERIARMVSVGGCVAAVSPQNWLFASSYRSFRRSALTDQTWELLARLGVGAFDGITGEVVDVHLLVTTVARPDRSHLVRGFDLTRLSGSTNKAQALRSQPVDQILQSTILASPDARVSFAAANGGELLEAKAASRQGLATGDDPRYKRFFWEVDRIPIGWVRHQTSVKETTFYGGCDGIVNIGELQQAPPAGCALRGLDVWGQTGISVRQTRPFPCSLYTGVAFDMNAAVLIPREPGDLAALWHYCTSPEFAADLHETDQSLKVTNASLVKVPFEQDRWRRVARESGPLPEPGSDDPTQWLFKGQPERSTEPLQAAVLRLLNYRWPDQSEADGLEPLSERDGIACLPSVAGKRPAGERLQQALSTAFGATWSPAMERKLLLKSGSNKNTLTDWLRDEFFKQHCSLFGNRPIVWHIWDGQRDGFSVLVNYHQLDRKTLEKLTYTYLGQDWVERQRAGVRDDVVGAEARLAAALELQRKLEAILAGERPFDIFVRWKELNEQPVGWDPNLVDGVRLNIRPFVQAGVLRSPFNINWTKDRGKDPDGTERHNDLHYSLAEKGEARTSVGRT